MKSWDVYTCDVGFGPHPAVIVSHPLRSANKPEVDIVRCSSHRAQRRAMPGEVLLDEADGLDWATLCFCDLIYTVPKSDLSQHRGSVSRERRRAIVQAIIQGHDWHSI